LKPFAIVFGWVVFRGVLHPCCQGDAARIGSIYGPLLLGENRRGEVIRHPFFDPGKFQPDLEGKEVHGISAGLTLEKLRGKFLTFDKHLSKDFGNFRRSRFRVSSLQNFQLLDI